MPPSMLLPLLSMMLGFMCFFGAVLCMRLRGEVLNRERQATWVREAINVNGGSFWSMGGYARFVWPCFGFACTVLAWNLWSARRYHAAARRRAVRALAMNDENR